MLKLAPDFAWVVKVVRFTTSLLFDSVEVLNKLTPLGILAAFDSV